MNLGWIAIPTGAAGGAMVYRKSMLAAAGFDAFPNDLVGFLRLCRALKAKGTPPGFALGHATGDANGWTHWVLWAHGGRLPDENSQIAINSKETVAALQVVAFSTAGEDGHWRRGATRMPGSPHLCYRFMVLHVGLRLQATPGSGQQEINKTKRRPP